MELRFEYEQARKENPRLKVSLPVVFNEFLTMEMLFVPYLIFNHISLLHIHRDFSLNFLH